MNKLFIVDLGMILKEGIFNRTDRIWGFSQKK